jgi:lipopolysaccharide export LptBFGC system permease protein LptF
LKGAARNRRLSGGLQLYLVREILKSFLLVMVVFEAVLGSIFCFGAVRNYGVDLGLLLPVLVPALIAYFDAAIPVSLLFATSLVYGRFIADREVAAMKSFGLSHLELALPPFAVGAVLSVIVLFCGFWWFPDLRFRRDNLGSLILERLRYLDEDSNQSFELGNTRTVWIERIRGQKLEGIFIAAEEGDDLYMKGLQRPDGKPRPAPMAYPAILYAAEGQVVSDQPGGKELAIELNRFSIFYDTNYRDPHVRTDFMHRIDGGKLRLPVRVEEADPNEKELTYPYLVKKLGEKRERWDQARGRKPPPPDLYRIRREYYNVVTEFHRRITFGLVNLTFPLAAAILALFLNSPNRLLPVFVSLMVVTPTFYMLEMWGNSCGREGIAPAVMEELGNLGVAALLLSLLFLLRRRTVW